MIDMLIYKETLNEHIRKTILKINNSVIDAIKQNYVCKENDVIYLCGNKKAVLSILENL